jgi:hypothetical protein
MKDSSASDRDSKTLLSRCQRRWQQFKDFLFILQPCWVPLLVLAGAFLSALLLSQAPEILRRLIEGAAATGKNERFHWLIALGATWLWGTANWYGSRLLFDDAARRSEEDEREWQGWLDQYAPRSLGCLPFVFVAVGFLVEAARYQTEGNRDKTLAGWSLGFGAIWLVMAIAFWILRSQSLGGKTKPVRLKGVKVARGDHPTQWWVGTLLLVDCVLLVVLTVRPDEALRFGSLAMLFVAAATLTIFGCWLLHFSYKWKLPLVVPLLVWVGLVSFCNDNHGIRSKRFENPITYHGITLEDRFERWCQMIEREYDYTDGVWKHRHPLYIVVAEGGGVRAAYWTAIVLGKLENERPWSPGNDAAHYYEEIDFASHVFAISGVSGGALGGTVFNALLAESYENKLLPVKDEPVQGKELAGLNFVEKAGAILGQDLLSPAVAGMLFPDGLQRFLPGDLLPDRAAALEHGWELAWRRAVKVEGKDSDRFARDFSALWGDQYSKPKEINSWVPSLFLNGTSVEGGFRTITSDLRIYSGQRGQFPQSEDSFHKLSFRPDTAKDGTDHPWEISGDIPLSTAADMSTRFPVISPAGRFPDGTHVVDGGYFDNSGAATAWDMIRSLKQYLEAAPNPKRDSQIVMKVIMIRFGDPNPMTASPPVAKGTTFLIDLKAPIDAILNRWSASGRGYQEELRAELPPRNPKKETAVEWQNDYYELCLDPRPDHPLPLGWLLSKKAADDMKSRIGASDSATSASETAGPPALEHTIKLILSSIPRKTDPPNAIVPAPTNPTGQ